MIVDDSFNYHARLKTNYHLLSSNVDSFFFRFTGQMIVHDNFLVSGGNQGGSMQYGYRIAIAL